MQTSPAILNGSEGNPLPLPSRGTPEAKRRVALHSICLTLFLLSIWSILFTKFFWLFIVSIPVNIIGTIAVRRMNKNWMLAYTMFQSLVLGFTLVSFVPSLVSGHKTNVFDFLYMGIIVIMQFAGVFLSSKIRRDILLAENMTSIELTNVVDQPQYPAQQSSLSPPPHMPVHPFQDPHATAGVPGYPYPPPQQYYPTPYMPQNMQGYPTPYAHYPQVPNGPVATYPAYSITDDQLHPLSQQQEQQQQQQQQQQYEQQQPTEQQHVPDTHPLLYTRE